MGTIALHAEAEARYQRIDTNRRGSSSVAPAIAAMSGGPRCRDSEGIYIGDGGE